MYQKLFEPVTIGNVHLKNRIVFAPVTTGYEEKGAITPKSLNFYGNLAKGGAGMIIIGDLTPQPSMAPTPAVYDDQFIPGLKSLAETVQKQGAKIAGQLFHQEYEMAAIMKIAQEEGRDAARKQLHADMQNFCNRLSKEEIQAVVDKFQAAAKRVEAAGFDMIQIHGDRLVGMFSSPILNQRTDEYGGPVENRARFALEVVRKVREAVPSMAIEYKMAIIRTDPPMGKGGPTLEEARQMAGWLVEAGVNSFHVSLANHSAIGGTIPPAGAMPYGCFADLAEGIKQSVSVPVTTVGRIVHPDFAENLLKENKADLVALARPLICDPQWPAKARQGRVDEIRECIMCNRGCTDNLMGQKPVRCVLNAGMGEAANPDLGPVDAPRRIVVIGGGPGGMEAARVAAKRGHQVTLIEKTGRLGGQLNVAVVAPSKDEMQRISDYLKREIKRLGVTVKLNTQATPELIEQLSADQVIVATGARPGMPRFPGSDLDHVVSAWKVLDGCADTGEKVVVKGGGMVGLETALFLGERGKTVVLATSRDKVGEDESPTAMPMIHRRIASYGIEVLANHSLEEITDREVRLKDKDGAIKTVSADTVVMAQRALPEKGLAEALKAGGTAYCCIGDCAEEKPRTLGDAIYEGFQSAVGL